MSDLVKRLREYAGPLTVNAAAKVYQTAIITTQPCDVHADLKLAADRIERLEAFVEKVRALPIAYTMHIYENITVPREYDSRFISKEGLDQALADLDRANNKETQ